MIEIEAKTLQTLGFKRAFVMHDWRTNPRKGWMRFPFWNYPRREFREGGSIRYYTLTPEEFGIKRARYEDIAPAAT